MIKCEKCEKKLDSMSCYGSIGEWYCFECFTELKNERRNIINLDVLKKLYKIEHQMDLANGEHGSKEKYCIYCKSCAYNSKVGIVHSKYCAISLIRGIMLSLQILER